MHMYECEVACVMRNVIYAILDIVLSIATVQAIIMRSAIGSCSLAAICGIMRLVSTSTRRFSWQAT